MKTNELLEKHPLTTEVIRSWFFDEMIKSLDDNNIPEEFKEMMKQEGVSNERLAILIDAQPRTLFDVFDENDLYINVVYTPSVFMCTINQNDIGTRVKTRKESELLVIEKAFELLEEQLSPIDLPEVKE